MIKYFPMLLTIWTRAKNLSGAMSSQTTQAQEAAVLALCGIIAAVGYFVPALAPDNVAQGAVLFLLAIVSPLLSRMLGKKEPEPSGIPANAGIFISHVRHIPGAEWANHIGAMEDARMDGWLEGADDYGNIYNLRTGAVIGKDKAIDLEQAIRKAGWKNTLEEHAKTFKKES